VIDPGSGDADPRLTAERRATIRRARLGGADPARPAPTAIEVHAVGGALVRDGGHWRCRCGHDLGPEHGSFKAHAHTRVVPDPHEHGPRLRLHPDLELREHCCPACATLLESEVARVGERSRVTVALH
jgi:hypothetical protein